MSTRIDGATCQIIPDDLYTSGEPSLNRLAAAAGDRFDVWQRQINRIILAKSADGFWSARNTVLSIPRQTGKTYDIGWVAIHRAARTPGMRIVWTAQHFSVIKDTFESLCAIVLRPEMSGLVDPDHGISRAAGTEEIRFRNGSRIFFRARERGALRGVKKIALLVIDEAQHLSDSAMASMLPTQNRAYNPQTIYMGTPPGPRDNGEAFTRLRDKTRAGRTHSTLYVEYAADRDADPLDRDQWRKANPSFPRRTSETSMLRMQRQLGKDSFKREALGIWDETTTSQAINPEQWAKAATGTPNIKGLIGYALDMKPDRRSLAIGGAVNHRDGTAHIELRRFEATQSKGTQWAVDYIADHWPRTASVVIDSQSPAMSLLADLKARHVKVIVTNYSDMGRACGKFLDMLRDGKLTHLPDDKAPALATAVANATTRSIGKSGAVGWNPMGSDIDISPLVACTLALYGTTITKRDPDRVQEVMIG